MNQFHNIATTTSKAFSGLLLLCVLLSSTPLAAQGWEKFVTGSDFDEFFDVTQTRDFGYLATGYINDDQIVVYRYDTEGEIIWTQENLSTTPGQGHAVIEAADGSIFMAGYCTGCVSGQLDLYVVKMNEFGNIVWTKGYGGPENEEAWDMIEATDGSIVITGYFETGSNIDVFLLKIDPTDGTVLLDRKYNGSDNRNDRGFGLTETFDNNYMIVGSTNIGANDSYAYLLKISNTTGDTIWTKEFTTGPESIGYDIIESIDITSGLPDGYAITGLVNNNDIYFLKTDLDGLELATANYGGAGSNQGSSIVQAKDGNYVIAGREGIIAAATLPVLKKVNQGGFVIWSRIYGDLVSSDLIAADAHGLTVNQEGGFAFAGLRSEGQFPFPEPANAYIIKVDEAGNYYTNIIQGRIFFDFDDDCEMDMNEFGFENWNIIAKGNKDFYQTTDADGNFSLEVASGSYVVEMIPPNDYWNSCTNSISVDLLAAYDSTTLNFPIQIDQLCAYLEVDASAPYLTPCTTNDYYISYSNKGTTSGKESYIIVDLDESLTLTDATAVYTALGDNSFRFDLGNVSISETDSFRVSVFVDCASLEGQTHCFEAHIFPDTLCVPVGNWDRASLELEATCNGANVDLRIRNIGDGDMSDVQGFVIIEDEVMLRPAGPIQLGKGEDSLIIRPADGTTYRIVMEQPDGHPGKSMPSVAIEGCVDGGGSFSTGFYTTFPENDADNFLVKDCQENIPSTDIPSHSKRGYPKGYGDDRLITPETDLKYVLNFENNGIDTAIRMVIRDTLSRFLDPTTVRPGASSHDFSYEVTSEGILKFTFEDINLLPGSSATSRGFVKYTVSQKPDNPAGALIKNGAAVFYNYGHPNYTQNTCHKIEDFVRVSTDEIFHPQVNNVKVFPNPFMETATVEISGTAHFNQVRFSVFDTSGKLVYRKDETGSVFTISRNNLPAGFYFYQLEADARLISTGKVVIQ